MCDVKAERASLEAYQNIVPPMPLHALYTPNCLLLLFVTTSFQPRNATFSCWFISLAVLLCVICSSVWLSLLLLLFYQDPTLGFYSNTDVFVPLPFGVNGMEGMRQPSPFIIIMTQWIIVANDSNKKLLAHRLTTIHDPTVSNSIHRFMITKCIVLVVLCVRISFVPNIWFWSLIEQ